jgi:hypothetical protein
VILAMIIWLHLSGGIAGINDEVSVADGRVKVHRGKQRCEFDLSDRDRDRLAQALRYARPDDWKPAYDEGVPCADCIVHTLQVGDRTVSWSLGKKLPKDAKAVADVLEDMMHCQ